MTNPPMDLLVYRAYPELATTLRSRTGIILQRWERKVLEVLPAAEHLTLGELRDHLPEVLAQMAEALEADEPGPTGEMIQIAQPHGDARFHDNYNVNELLIEYELLRRIITEEIADHFARDLTTDEIVALNMGIDTAARRGVVRFVHHLVKKMREADDLHARYISFLNHDLRGGMNGVLLVAEVLKRELGADPRFAETQDDLAAMQRAVLQTVGAMDRFVFASRLVRGQYEPKYQPVAIKSLLTELMASAGDQARQRGIEFVIDVGEDCTVTSDLELMRFILENLLTNTIKHAKAGGGKVRMTVKPRESAGCVIAISDQGSGIDAEQLKTILSPAAAHRPGEKSSPGLGLFVSGQAARIIGGKLTVQSTPGIGSTFTLELPDRP